MDLPILNSKSKTSSVSEIIFNQPVNKELVTQLINSFVSNSHQGTKAQKNRSDVSGGGKKPWRQKGTGRARAGTIRSPIWKGGGVTFAARSKSSNPKKINRKMYKSAMRSILSSLVEENRVVLGSSINIENPKTKDLIDFMNKIGFKGGLIIVNEISENIKLASRNIPNLQIVDVNSIDPISLLRHESTLISEDSLPKLEELLT
ncbi:50S ribosomal protein L4 [SAR86 cluster bacterium]|jgi:large subunit ribosomal protein L4|nr:50S ribosomal protein L4 [SAR86 cluster bacterium]